MNRKLEKWNRKMKWKNELGKGGEKINRKMNCGNELGKILSVVVSV